MGPIPRHPTSVWWLRFGHGHWRCVVYTWLYWSVFLKVRLPGMEAAGLCRALQPAVWEQTLHVFQSSFLSLQCEQFPDRHISKKIQIELFSSWKCFLNLKSSNLCWKIERKSDWFWAHNFTNIWMRFETSRHCMYAVSSIWAITLIFKRIS